MVNPSPTAVVRRGFDNAIANWPLLLIRVAENVAMIAVIVLPVLAIVLPMAFYGTLNGWFETIAAAQSPADLLGLPLLLTILGAIIVLTIGFGLAMIVHAFVEGGVVGCYIDGDRAAGESEVVPRTRYRVFSPERWLLHARRNWWPIFLIYNVTWSVFGLILLIPIVILAVMIFALRERPELIVLPIFGFIAMIFVAILIGIIIQLWSTASVVMSVNGRGVGRALRDGWNILFSRFLPIALLIVIAFVIHGAIGGSMAMASMGVGFISAAPGVGMFMLPLQIAISLLQTAVTLAISSWFLAAFVAVVIR